MTIADLYLTCFLVGFVLSALSVLLEEFICTCTCRFTFTWDMLGM